MTTSIYQAYRWTLTVPEDPVAAESDAENDQPDPTESAFPSDAREEIDPLDFYDGGKYRCKDLVPPRICNEIWG